MDHCRKTADLNFFAVLVLALLLVSYTKPAFAQVRYTFTYPDRSSLLADGWDFIARTSAGTPRNTEQLSGAVVSYDQSVHPGVLRIPDDEGDLWGGINSTRNTLFRNLPADWTSIRLLIKSFNPTLGNQQATLVAYQDDDNYVQISRTFEEFNRIFFTSETGGNGENVNSINETATENIYLRLDRDGNTDVITSYYSLDGSTWIMAGTIQHPLANARLAIEVGASPSGFPNADLAWAEVSTDPLPPVTDVLRAHPGNLLLNAVQGKPLASTRSIFLFTAAGGVLRWNVTADVPWIVPGAVTGLTEGVLSVGVDPAGLEAGIFTGTITLKSLQSTAEPILIPVTLIVNPDVPVSVTTWKYGKRGAMSVSIDDGQPSAFNELLWNGFKGTYVLNGINVPSFYPDYYNSGMELGSHLVTHPCYAVTDDVLLNKEIQPNIAAICAGTTEPTKDLVTLVWPCGFTNYREQSVATNLFLSARGYNINELEDATPSNLMNLKSYNSHEHTPFPPEDLKTVVDSAVLRQKWFNLVLHNFTNDDGAISYAQTRDIWVSSIGAVIKYILQRDRLIVENYSADSDRVYVDLRRLSVPSSPMRTFEDAFDSEDVSTVQMVVDDHRLVETVMLDGAVIPYEIKRQNGSEVVLVNVRLGTDVARRLEIRYLKSYVLFRNFPNPFTTVTWIEFNLAADCAVTIEIYNALGMKMETLANGYLSSGGYTLKWDARNYNAGTYYLIMKSSALSGQLKMVLVK